MANNITIGGQTYDLSTQSGRADARTNNPGLIVDATSVYNPSTGVQSNASAGSGAQPVSGSPAPQPSSTVDASALSRAIQQAVTAVSSSDTKAFNEAVNEFNQNFGLSKDQFAEAIRQYNQNFGVTQAGLTGTYQGQPTQQALAQYANFLGTYNGQQTLQAQNQYFNQALAAAGLTGTYQGTPTQQALAQRANLANQFEAMYGYAPSFDAQGNIVNPVGAGGTNAATLAAQQQAYSQQLGAIQAAAALQANPFRQQQVIGQLGNLLTGVGGVAGFQAPQTVAGVGTAGGTGPNTGLAYMQQMIDDIRNPGANQASMSGVLNAIPTPNKINSADFLRSAPSTQNLVLQGMQERYGLDPADSLAQIKNTLPAFQSPTTFGTIKG